MLPCLILAGGLGTRLRPVIGEDRPKALASIDGAPFLSWMLRGLAQQGVTDVVLSVGHGRDYIRAEFGDECFGMTLTFVEEDEPLGTGGAILHAMKTVGASDMIVMNGDTISDLDLQALTAFYAAQRPDLAMAATLVADASRYGTLEFDSATRRLNAFHEKRPGQGYINAGTYVVGMQALLRFDLPQKFSFEQDFLGKFIDSLDIRVFPDVTEFIDIGIPADYQRAQTVVPAMMEPRASEA